MGPGWLYRRLPGDSCGESRDIGGTVVALSKTEIVQVYRRRARRYNFTAQLYYLMGFREWAYRRKAVKALALKRGDTVVEIGCGTGLNFRLFEDAVGAEGRIIGVDMTDRMLEGAREAARANHWENVDLTLSDATSYRFPRGVQGVISTFAITLIPEYEDIIRNAAEALEPEGRMVILDFKMPSGWLRRLAPLLAFLTRPFAVTLDLGGRRPWEAMQKYFTRVSVQEYFGGATYIAVGTSPKRG